MEKKKTTARDGKNARLHHENVLPTRAQRFKQNAHRLESTESDIGLVQVEAIFQSQKQSQGLSHMLKTNQILMLGRASSTCMREREATHVTVDLRVQKEELTSQSPILLRVQNLRSVSLLPVRPH